MTWKPMSKEETAEVLDEMPEEVVLESEVFDRMKQVVADLDLRDFVVTDNEIITERIRARRAD